MAYYYRLNLDERKMSILLSWISGNFKPTDEDIDQKIISQLKDGCEKIGCEDIWDDWMEKPKTIGVTEDDEFENNPKGKFECMKCGLRTNEKTYETMCVKCGGDLIRHGDNIRAGRKNG